MKEIINQTLDEMVLEKEAFLSDNSDKAFNSKAHKAANKATNELRKNYEDAIKNMGSATNETALVLRPSAKAKDVKLPKQVINAIKKHPYLAVAGTALTGATAVDLAEKIKNRHSKEDTEKAASELLDEMVFEKEAAIGAAVAQFGKNLINSGTMQKAIGVGKNIMNSGTMQKAVSTGKNLWNSNAVQKTVGMGKNFMNSNMGKSLMDSAKVGLSTGAVYGALNPGTDENGNKRSRLGGAIRGAMNSAGTNMAITGVMGAGSAAWNTAKNAWPTKTASELLDEMVFEKEAEWDPGTVMGGIMGGITGFGSAQKKGLNWKDTALKVGTRAATGAILGGTINGVANYISNKSQAMPNQQNQQDYYGKQNLNG